MEWFSQQLHALAGRHKALPVEAHACALPHSHARRIAPPGTAVQSVNLTIAESAPGWWRSTLAGGPATGGQTLGTGWWPRFETMVRAATSWWYARPSRPFPESRHQTQGTASARISSTGFRAAPGWWRARGPVNLSRSADTSSGDGEFGPGQATYHLPVLPDECLHWMQPAPGRFIIDGTLGGGGHSEAFLNAGASVLGVDRDPEALSHARERLTRFGDRFSTWEGNFAKLPDCPALAGGPAADGLLLDLGVSSRQLDSAARGFSFMRGGPLDMRMGPSSPRTAADLVNSLDEASLARILFEFGEEPKARRIAAAIAAQRQVKPFSDTVELAGCIERAIGRHGRIHPATKTFQALRMAVNEELDSLSTVLRQLPRILKPGGLLLVITFHSLEDRLVKQFLKHRSSRWIDDPTWPEPRANPDFQFELLSRKAVLPTAAESRTNPRARSSKLRVARLLPTPP